MLTFMLLVLSLCAWNLRAQTTRTVSPLRPDSSQPIPAQRSATHQSQPVADQPAVVAGQAKIVRVEDDTKVDLRGLGGELYSTGLEDVWVRMILPKIEGKDHPNVCHVYLVSNTNKQYLGSNRDKKSLRLGKLPVGEIVIETLNTLDKKSYQTGVASRNPDKLPHATVRQLPTGVVDVRFEDSYGNGEEKMMRSRNHWERKYAHDHFFQDVILQFSGGVTADPVLMTLLPTLKDTDLEKRKTAETVLKQAYPKIARVAGIR